MPSLHFIRSVLRLTACIWGLSAAAAFAAVDDQPLPVLLGELRDMSPLQHGKALHVISLEIVRSSPELRVYRRAWMKEQWADLSPEQREQLRNQIRDHWQRMTPEQRQMKREERRAAAEDHDGRREDGDVPQDDAARPAHMSPEDRQQFRQWMREQRGRGGPPRSRE